MVSFPCHVHPLLHNSKPQSPLFSHITKVKLTNKGSFLPKGEKKKNSFLTLHLMLNERRMREITNYPKVIRDLKRKSWSGFYDQFISQELCMTSLLLRWRIKDDIAFAQ